MNAHQRAKLRKRQESERRTLGKMHTSRDTAIYYDFIRLLRDLVGIPDTQYRYRFNLVFRRSKEEEALVKEMQAAHRSMMEKMETDLYWSIPIV